MTTTNGLKSLLPQWMKTMTPTNKPPWFDIDDAVVFGKNKVVTFGEPLRIDGRQGLWRYIARTGAYVEVVGPYFPTNPSRNGERTRIFPVDQLKYPGNKFKAIDVAPSPTVTAISEQAKNRKK